jgi:hypothetical protein
MLLDVGVVIPLMAWNKMMHVSCARSAELSDPCPSKAAVFV